MDKSKHGLSAEPQNHGRGDTGLQAVVAQEAALSPGDEVMVRLAHGLRKVRILRIQEDIECGHETIIGRQVFGNGKIGKTVYHFSEARVVR